jgi:hypothetical protein
VRLGQTEADAEAELRACSEAACAAVDFLRDHPATVEITGGRSGSARVPSDHPLPVGLAEVVEHVPVAQVEACARVLAAWLRRELVG